MKTNRPKPRRLVARVALVAAVAALLATALACPFAGRYLIVDRPLQPADAVVVLAGARVERWLEAVDLYNEKMARRVLLSAGRVESAETTLRKRGVRFPLEADLAREAIIQLGVPAGAVEVIPRSLDNTAQEAAAAREFAVARRWSTVIVVTSKFHTRRSLYAFEREFRGTNIRIQVRGSRHDAARPDGWWRRRGDFRWVTSELQKLLAYRLGLTE
ncbi:MAG TPA: YdcF family protein [Vicinamibacterales bacterium]|nr:YdcF family protein [Vicinamibacterales bacterium]